MDEQFCRGGFGSDGVYNPLTPMPGPALSDLLDSVSVKRERAGDASIKMPVTLHGEQVGSIDGTGAERS